MTQPISVLAALAGVEFTWWVEQGCGWIPNLASAKLRVRARARNDDALALALCSDALEAHPDVHRVLAVQVGPLKHSGLRVWVRGHPGIVLTVIGEALGKPDALF